MRMITRNNGTPLYLQLADLLREQITSGEFQPGDRLPSETKLVNQYGIARLTVREALQQLVNEGLIEKRHGKGSFCKNAAVRKKIDVLLNMTDYYFMPYYMQSISDVLDDYQADLVAGDTKNSCGEICRLLDRIGKRGSDGIILQASLEMVFDREALLQAFEKIEEQNIPLIMIDHSYAGIASSKVVMDERKAGKLAGECFLRYGHSKLAGVLIEHHAQSVERMAGFGDVVKEYAPIPVGAELKIKLRQAIEDGVTGLFCFSDFIAKVCIDLLDEMGCRIPEDISIISVDDTELAKAYHLTSVSHPKQKLGAYAARAMMQGKIPVQKIFTPLLTERESVKKKG